MRRVVLFLLLTLLISNISIAENKNEKRWSVDLTKGVKYVKVKRKISRGPVLYHVLKVNLDADGISIKPALAHRNILGRDSVKKITRQHLGIAGINGSFFTTDDPYYPVGRIVLNGKSIFKGNGYRSVFGLTHGKKPFFQIPKIKDYVVFNFNEENKLDIWGINRPRKEDEITLYTPDFGSQTKTNDFGDEIVVEHDRIVDIRYQKGNSYIPKDGYVLSFHGKNKANTKKLKLGTFVHVKTEPSLKRLNIKHAIAGGPRLLKNGKIVVHPYVHIESFSNHFYTPNARTAIAINKTGEVLLIVVEKNKKSVGVTFTELAWILKGMQITDAMALDGGSSSSIFVDNVKAMKHIKSSSYPMINNALVIGVDK